MRPHIKEIDISGFSNIFEIFKTEAKSHKRLIQKIFK